MSSATAFPNHASPEKLLRASFRQGKHDALIAYLESSPVVPPNWFAESLRPGLILVSNKKKTVSDVTPTMALLLKYAAKRNSAQPFFGEKTPYHVVCLGEDDPHEILVWMIKELGLPLINAQDDLGRTALMCAVQNAHIKCVEELIANGADVNLMMSGERVVTPLQRYKYRLLFSKKPTIMVSPLIDSISLLHPTSLCSSNVMMEIFDLLLERGADINTRCPEYKRTPLMHAAIVDNVYCVKKLIEKGADIFETDLYDYTTWMLASNKGSVNVLKWLIEDNGLDKDSVDKKGCSVLCWAVRGMNIDAVRYLLSLGVSTAKYTPQEKVQPCLHCARKLPYVHVGDYNLHPCMEAITSNKVDMIKLLEEHGCQLYKHLYALSYAVRTNSVEVVKYFLSKYRYQLNSEYMGGELRWNPHTTLLAEGCQTKFVKVVKLLLEQGADPNVNNSVKTCSSAINVAIFKRHVEVIARFIRGGVYVNAKSFYPGIGAVLPFEAAVWHHHSYAAQMLLVSGSSFGVFSLPKEHKCKVDVAPDLQELLEEWDVQKNNVLPLQQRCRMVILNHLSPQADQKIKELPLPQLLIKYLSIPELDDIIEASKSKPQTVWQRKRYRVR